MNKILNPFYTFSEKQLLVAGILITLIGIALCTFFNVHFIGILKMDPTGKVQFYQSVIEIINGVLSLSLCYFLIGKIINKKTRFIDILTTALIAMLPLYLTAIFNVNNYISTTSDKLLNSLQVNEQPEISSFEMIYIMIFAFAMILFLILFIILLFNGFKTATNAKGVKHIVYFAVTLIIADILSKFIISNFN